MSILDLSLVSVLLDEIDIRQVDASVPQNVVTDFNRRFGVFFQPLAKLDKVDRQKTQSRVLKLRQPRRFFQESLE